MKHLITIFSIAIVLASCTKTEVKTVNIPKDSDTIQTKKEFVIDSLSVFDSLQVAKTLTLSFEKQILLFPDITNKTILDSIYKPADMVSADYSKKSLAKDLESLKKASLVKDEAQEYMPEFKQTWDEASGMTLISHENDLLTLLYSGSGYSGGAHGYYYESYKVFDLKKNVVINQKDVFKNPNDPAWAKILNDHFTDPDQRDMLLADKITLNNNFFFDDQKITFVYNQYEITAYAAGVVNITIKFSEIKNMLKPEFIKEYKIK